MAPGDDLAKEGARKKEEKENCRSEFSKKERPNEMYAGKKERSLFLSRVARSPPPSLPLFASGKIKGHLRRPKEEADREKRPRFFPFGGCHSGVGTRNGKEGRFVFPRHCTYSRYGMVHFKALISAEEEKTSV